MADPEVQRVATGVITDLVDNTRLSAGPANFWLEEFLLWAPFKPELMPYVTEEGYFDGTQSNVSRAAFNRGVELFLETYPFDRHSKDLV